jgi:hypothetical protein
MKILISLFYVQSPAYFPRGFMTNSYEHFLLPPAFYTFRQSHPWRSHRNHSTFTVPVTMIYNTSPPPRSSSCSTLLYVKIPISFCLTPEIFPVGEKRRFVFTYRRKVISMHCILALYRRQLLASFTRCYTPITQPYVVTLLRRKIFFPPAENQPTIRPWSRP